MRITATTPLAAGRWIFLLISLGLIAAWVASIWLHADYVVGQPPAAPPAIPAQPAAQPAPAPQSQNPDVQYSAGVSRGAIRLIQFGSASVRPGWFVGRNSKPGIDAWWRSEKATPDQPLHRQIIIPLWIPAALASILTALLWTTALPPKGPYCKRCGVNLRDCTSILCPSCGLPVARSIKNTD